ncbi:MAG: hypothetical protein L0Z62_40380 [Gemmataceae bacterium]|nr:hypothetical protein [Gemmataceae bacterium]
MRPRWLVCLPLLALLALPGAAPAQKAGTPPTLIVRVRSLDALLEGGKLLTEALGKGDLLGQVEDLLKSKVGPKGLDGAVDPRRPLGLYARVGKEITDLQAVLLVPVASEKGFLDLLDGLNFKAEKGEGGLYTVKQNILPLDVYLRFAHQYAYLTPISPDALDKKTLIDPRQLFTPGQTATVSLTLRIDQVPEMARNALLGILKDELEKVRAQKEKGESEARHNFQMELLNEIERQVVAVVRDGVELNALIDVDARKKALSADVTLTAKPDSPLHKTITALGKSKSQFGGLLRDGAALNLLVRYELPEKLRAALGGVLKEAADKALAGTTDPLTLPSPPSDGGEGRVRGKEQAARLIEAMKPTLAHSEVDFGVSLRGPSEGGHYTLVAGMRLQEGEKLHQTLRELLEDVPEKEKTRIKLDVEKVGNSTIHRLDVSKGLARAKAAFGDEPLYLAFRPDAVLVGLGEDGLKSLKEVLTTPAPATAPLRFEVSLHRLAAVTGRSVKQGEDDHVRIALEGGSQLRVRFHMGLSVVRLLSGMANPAGKE